MKLFMIKMPDEREIEVLSKNDNIEKIIKDNLNEKEFSEFCYDEEEFMKRVEYHSIPISKKLWYITTNQKGYDTYDSGVICAYTEKQAIEISEKDMSNISKKYENRANFIGEAKEDLLIGKVCYSFNAG